MSQNTLFIGEEYLGGQDDRREEKGEGRGDLGLTLSQSRPLSLVSRS